MNRKEIEELVAKNLKKIQEELIDPLTAKVEELSTSSGTGSAPEVAELRQELAGVKDAINGAASHPEGLCENGHCVGCRSSLVIHRQRVYPEAQKAMMEQLAKAAAFAGVEREASVLHKAYVAWKAAGKPEAQADDEHQADAGFRFALARR